MGNTMMNNVTSLRILTFMNFERNQFAPPPLPHFYPTPTTRWQTQSLHIYTHNSSWYLRSIWKLRKQIIDIFVVILSYSLYFLWVRYWSWILTTPLPPFSTKNYISLKALFSPNFPSILITFSFLHVMNSYNDPSPFFTKNYISLKAPFFLYFSSYELISACYSCFKFFFRHFLFFPFLLTFFAFFFTSYFSPSNDEVLNHCPQGKKVGENTSPKYTLVLLAYSISLTRLRLAKSSTVRFV